MTLTEILDRLTQHQALVVHCAGFAKGVGNAYTNSLGYLERLNLAAENNFELSCSTVLPGDKFSYFNYTGKVGLILRPNTAKSITFASPTDAGSQINPANPSRRTHNCGPVSIQTIDNAILNRHANDYNELGLHDFTVVGIFVDPPIEYSCVNGVHYLLEDDVVRYFPEHEIFCLRNGELYLFNKTAGSWGLGKKIAAKEIYRLPDY